MMQVPGAPTAPGILREGKAMKLRRITLVLKDKQIIEAFLGGSNDQYIKVIDLVRHYRVYFYSFSEIEYIEYGPLIKVDSSLEPPL